MNKFVEFNDVFEGRDMKRVAPERPMDCLVVRLLHEMEDGPTPPIHYCQLQWENRRNTKIFDLSEVYRIWGDYLHLEKFTCFVLFCASPFFAMTPNDFHSFFNIFRQTANQKIFHWSLQFPEFRMCEMSLDVMLRSVRRAEKASSFQQIPRI